MTPFWADSTGLVTLYAGDVLDVLACLPSGSVQCCVTSPPYFALRDYGTAQWEGGDAECDHIKSTARQDGNRQGVDGFAGSASGNGSMGYLYYTGTCGKCGAVRIDQQIGLEATVDAYIAKMVAVFREVRRVLRNDGTCWINIGDSYAGSGKGGNPEGSPWSGFVGNSDRQRSAMTSAGKVVPSGLKPKDLMLIPERLAIALQADGWWVRSRIAWAKKAPMPESTRDRPSSAWEHIWLLTKAARYYYDADAVREPMSPATAERDKHGFNGAFKGQFKGTPGEERWQDGRPIEQPSFYNPAGRNLRNFWLLGPSAFPAAHFATFPPEIPRRAILAGTSERGCCPACGAPWVRVTELSPEYVALKTSRRGTEGYESRGLEAGNRFGSETPGITKQVQTTGWRQSCTCPPAEPVPCVVLDPFVGSGTTAMVARQLVRRAVGIDLNPDYLALAIKRVQSVEPGFQTDMDALWDTGSDAVTGVSVG